MQIIFMNLFKVFKDFEYHRSWLSPEVIFRLVVLQGKNEFEGLALEFSCTIGDSGKRMDGIDLLKLNDKCLVSEFRVLARPIEAIAELKKFMQKNAGPMFIEAKKRGMLPKRAKM